MAYLPYQTLIDILVNRRVTIIVGREMGKKQDFCSDSD